MTVKRVLGTLYIIILVQCVVSTKFQLYPNYCLDNPSFGSNFEREEFATLDDNVYSIAYSHHLHNIYIIDWSFRLFRINLTRTGLGRIILDQCQPLGIAADGREPILYLGCKTGLATYDEVKGTFKNVPGIRDAFAKLYVPRYTSDLFTINNNNHEINLYHSLTSDPVKLNFTFNGHLRDQLVVDGEGNYAYTTKDFGTFVVEIVYKGVSEPLPYNAGEFVNLAVDRDGRVFGTSDKGLFRIHTDGRDPQFMATLDFSPLHMYFDMYDNIICGTYDKRIVYLRFSYDCYDYILENVKNSNWFDT